MFINVLNIMHQLKDSNVSFFLVSENLKLLHVGPDEIKFAQNSLFSRHPVMKSWPKDHGKLSQSCHYYFTPLVPNFRSHVFYNIK